MALELRKKLEESLKRCRFCHVTWNGEDGYEILAWGTKYVVDIKNLSCDCRAWQLIGILCCHAMCALMEKGLNPDDYVHNFYRKNMSLNTYGAVIQPIRDSKFWQKSPINDPPNPPKFKKKIGRPKKLRKNGVLDKKIDETRIEMLSRKGTMNTCTLCKQSGHKRRSCTRRGSISDNTTQPSQSVNELLNYAYIYFTLKHLFTLYIYI